MKKITLFGVALLFLVNSAKSQITFTVKPGLNLNGANFGYKTKNFVPYFGLQFLNLTDKFKDNNTDRKTKTHIYMPIIGSKIFIIDKESLKGLINATLFKPVIFGKEVENGEEDESYKEDFKSLKLWGGELGFGSEYFFNEHFSFGGEFGFRFGFYNYKNESNTSEFSYTENMHLNMTYISGSMNFYF